jgi:hypothetical protein
MAMSVRNLWSSRSTTKEFVIALASGDRSATNRAEIYFGTECHCPIITQHRGGIPSTDMMKSIDTSSSDTTRTLIGNGGPSK